MLESPDLQDKDIVDCLENEYELAITSIDFLPLGADLNTAVYRVSTADDSYFLKLPILTHSIPLKPHMTRRKSKKKQKGKPARKSKARRQPKNKADDVLYLEYKITDEPIHSPAYRRLPQAVKDQIQRLRGDVQSKRVKETIEELLVLKDKYPNVPLLYNYLTTAYVYNREMDKANEITLECIQTTPDYLFARLNYIEFCLREERYDEIPAIIDHKFDLKLLYPKRKTFHISEYMNFMGIVGLYFAKIGEHERAQYYLDSLQQIAPDERITRILNQELHPNLLRRIIKNKVITETAKSSVQE